jgi:hypothetical protein
MDTSTSFISIIFLAELLNMATVRNSEVMLGQMLNHSVQDSVILCNAITFKPFNLLLSNARKVGGTDFSTISYSKPTTRKYLRHQTSNLSMNIIIIAVNES